MTFIVILLALLIERFFDWSHLRHWHWYANYERRITQRFTGLSPLVLMAVILLPPLLVVLIVNAILTGALYGLLKLIFQLVVVLYCLGPRNLWADAFVAINALVQSDSTQAAQKLTDTFNITDLSTSQVAHKNLINYMLIAANRRVFAVIFWYFVLGPVGAVLYRLMVNTWQTNLIPDTGNKEVALNAEKALAFIDWAPIRVFTGIFALGGHFAQVLAYWRKMPWVEPANNEIILTESGMAALGIDDQTVLAEDGSVERNAISLLDRSFVIVLVITAIFALLA